ncbi:MAG: hypothetical protein HFH80_09740 [Lachnospiraceae bacterium]|nr:hypothetical protein [Lachnospiraceae bacterium]
MKIRKIMHKKLFFLSVSLLLCALFSIYYFFMSRQVILHADDAYQGVYWYHMLTVGNEKIYRLNMSLGTLISLISYFFTGISLNTPYITYAIEYALLIWVTIFLSVPQGKKARYVTLPVFAYTMGCINDEAVLIFRAHMDIIILAYIALICLEYLEQPDLNKWRRPVYVIFFFALVFGRLAIDYLFLIIAIVPIILIESFRYFHSRQKTSLWIVILTASACLFAGIAEKAKELIITVMSRPAGEHTNTVIFGNFETMEHNFRNLVYSLLHMFDSYFLNENMLQVKTFFWFLNGCVLLLGLYLVIQSLCNFYKYILYKTACDYISAILSVGITGIILSFLLTQVATDYTCWRYAISVFSGMVLLIVRKLYYLDFQLFHNRASMNIISLILILFLPFNFHGIPGEKATDERDRLAIFLESQNLISGFCDLWHASYLDAASRGTLHLIPLNYGNNGYYQWGTRFENWHSDQFNFIIEDTTMPIRQFTNENIVREFGNPVSSLVYDKYIIYIYDYDLSTRIVWEDNLSDQQYKLEQAKNLAKTSIIYLNTYKNDIGDYYLGKGAEIIGPNITLSAGDYILTIAGDNLNSAEKGFPFAETPEMYKVLAENDKYCKIKFTLASEQTLCLFTLKNNQDSEIVYYYYGLSLQQ